MNINTPLVVLHSFRYADDKIIAECLSPTHGRVSLLIKISHSPRAKLRHNMFHAMAFLEVEWKHNPRSQLQRPQTARYVEHFFDLQSHPHKISIVSFLAEFLLHLVRNEDFNQDLYHYVYHAMAWLNAAQQDFSNFHLVFLLRLSLFTGISPNTSDTLLPYFDFLAGEFVEQIPQHAHFVSNKEARDLALLMRINFGTMHLLQLNRYERQRILELALHYYRLHLPHFPEMRSLKVLQELYEV